MTGHAKRRLPVLSPGAGRAELLRITPHLARATATTTTLTVLSTVPTRSLAIKLGGIYKISVMAKLRTLVIGYRKLVVKKNFDKCNVF